MSATTSGALRQVQDPLGFPAVLAVLLCKLLHVFVFTVREKIGAIATPDYIQNAPGLPKTRSGNETMTMLVWGLLKGPLCGVGWGGGGTFRCFSLLY